MRHFPIWLTATVALVVLFLGAGVWYYYQLSNRVLWSMVNVSDDETSADAHLLEFPDGHTVLIDAGDGESARRALIPYLEQRGINRVDQLVVTHPDRSRYGGIAPLLEEPGLVQRVYFNLPAESGCRTTSGCDFADASGTRDLIERSGASVRPMSTDELLYHSEEHDIILEVVHAGGGPAPTGVNQATRDAGALIRLIYGNTTVLFAGDMKRRTGEHLIDENFFLDSTLMTVPLQRTGDEASGRFLDQVSPEAILVSNGARQWHGRSGDPVRQFAVDRGIDTFITGVHGNVTVALKRDGFNINTERMPEEP